MKTLFRGVAITLLIAGAAASCAEEKVEVPVTAQKMLGYSTNTGQVGKGETRAVEFGLQTIKDDLQGLRVRVYLTNDGSLWNSWYLTWVNDPNDKWSYNGGVALQHPDEELIHYAVYPNTFDANIDGNEAEDIKAGTASFEFEVPGVGAQYDLMADVGVTTKQANNCGFAMSHILALVNFSVEGYTGANVVIENIELKGIKNSGKYTFANTGNGDWSLQNGSADYTYEIQGDSSDPGYEQTGWVAGSTWGSPAGTEIKFGNWDLNGNEKHTTHSNGLMLLPQSFVGNDAAKLLVTYSVYNSGDYEGKGSPVVASRTVTTDLKTIMMEDSQTGWIKGRRYRYNIQIDPANIRMLTYSVNEDGWSTGNAGNVPIVQ